MVLMIFLKNHENIEIYLNSITDFIVNKYVSSAIKLYA